MNDSERMVGEIRAILAAFNWEQDDRQYALEAIERIVSAGDQAVSDLGPRTFHGLSGETLTAGHDADGVVIRADFHEIKLSALGARELAAHLTGCAGRAEAWMFDAAGHSRRASRCAAGVGLQRCILTAGHPGPHDPDPDPGEYATDCGCGYCLDEPEPEPEPEPESAGYDPGPEVDDQGGMSEYRYHEPEPWQ